MDCVKYTIASPNLSLSGKVTNRWFYVKSASTGTQTLTLCDANTTLSIKTDRVMAGVTVGSVVLLNTMRMTVNAVLSATELATAFRLPWETMESSVYDATADLPTATLTIGQNSQPASSGSSGDTSSSTDISGGGTVTSGSVPSGTIVDAGTSASHLVQDDTYPNSGTTSSTTQLPQ